MSPTIVKLHPGDDDHVAESYDDLSPDTRAKLERDDQLIASIEKWGIDTERRMQGIEGKHRGNIDLLRQENDALRDQVRILTDRVSALEAAALDGGRAPGLMPVVLAGCVAIVSLLMGALIGRR